MSDMNSGVYNETSTKHMVLIDKLRKNVDLECAPDTPGH